MFLFKFLGLLDLLCGVLLFISPIAPLRLIFGAALYLGLKGFIFRGDFFSFIDIAAAVYFFITLITPLTFFTILFGIYLLLKGFYSILV